MADLEQINQAQLSSALTTTAKRSSQQLNDAEYAQLSMLFNQMQERYPSQDLAGATEGYLQDFERLAVKHSLVKVQAALAELRIKPGQKFFPAPDQVAEEMERQKEQRHQEAQRDEGNKWLRDWNRHVQACTTGKSHIVTRKPVNAEQVQAQPAKIYAAWKCAECGVTRGGYILPSDFRPRRCEGIPRTKRTDGGRICGGLMVESYREAV